MEPLHPKQAERWVAIATAVREGRVLRSQEMGLWKPRESAENSLFFGQWFQGAPHDCREFWWIIHSYAVYIRWFRKGEGRFSSSCEPYGHTGDNYWPKIIWPKAVSYDSNAFIVFFQNGRNCLVQCYSLDHVDHGTNLRGSTKKTTPGVLIPFQQFNYIKTKSQVGGYLGITST